MARPKSPYPSYRLHKRSGQAIVTLGSRMVSLGPFDSYESRAAYDQAVTQWVAQGAPAPARLPD